MISQEERIRLIQESFAWHSDFPKKGISFCDMLPVFAHPTLLRHVVDSLELALQGVEFDKIIGLEARGFLFGVPLAYKMQKTFVPIRKAGKLCGEVARVSYDLHYGKDTIQIQKYSSPQARQSIKPGDKVVLIDDLLATGGTMSASIKLVTEVGADIVKILCVADVPKLKGVEKLSVDKTKFEALIHLK